MRKHIRTVYTVDCILQICVSRTLKHGFAILHKFKGNVGARHQHAGNVIADVSGFSPCAFNEFQACRNIEKQVLYLNCRTLRSTCGMIFFYFAATDAKERSCFFLCRAGFKRYMRNSGDGSKRFTTEAKRLDMRKVVRSADFVCRMPEERGFHILSRNTATVVCYANGFESPAFCFDGDSGGACVKRVFNELFYNGSRPLNHLSCGDLICRKLA